MRTFRKVPAIPPPVPNSQSFNCRWHDEKVSSLQLSAPLSVLPLLSVEQAITIMNEEGYDQLPVIDETG